MSHDEKILIRASTAEDAVALHRLAALDSSLPLRGRALVGEVNGSIRAALPLDGGRAIADPFAESAHVVELLLAHRDVLHAPAAPGHAPAPAGETRLALVA
ncbi:MAG TPA: hypothetical protein VF545_12015 [Thermoleophilaceae bacterium]|jgi:hypothetical protein